MIPGISYRLAMLPAPDSDYLSVEAVFSLPAHFQGILQFAAWRPGRYCPGNFLSGIRGLQFFDAQDNPVFPQRQGTDTFFVEGNFFKASYQVWAGDLNAGSCFANPHPISGRLQINPIVACLMVPQLPQLPCTLHLKLPQHWKHSSGLPAQRQQNELLLQAPDFDTLADEPILAGPNLLTLPIPSGKLSCSLQVLGDFPALQDKLQADLGACCLWQIEAFQGLDAPHFRFLLQTLPYRAYHGVEHCNNTLCVLGPSDELDKEGYEEMLSLFSHEFYHAWNVKRLRPASWTPYPLHKPAPENLAWVAEGITTYMGEMALVRAKVFPPQKALNDLATWWQRHWLSQGRFFMNLADAAYETWIDGYGGPARARRISIYNEGALAAFLLDVSILTHNPNADGIQAAMRSLYQNPTLRGQGYSLQDFRAALEMVAGKSMDAYLHQILESKKGYDELLQEALDRIGCQMLLSYPLGPWEHRMGIRWNNGGNKIQEVAPNSPAALAGLREGDLWQEGKPQLNPGNAPYRFLRLGEPMDVLLDPAPESFFPVPTVEPMKSPSVAQHALLQRWLGQS